MFAVIKNGGKQYRIKEGDIIRFDKMADKNPKDIVEFKEVLAINNGEFKVGTPFLDGVVFEGEVVNNGKEKKVIIFKKRRRKDSKLKKGFRREFTKVKITKISA